MSRALSKSTIATYNSGAKTFLSFSAMYNIPKMPPSNLPICTEEVLMYFVSHCISNLKLSYVSVKSYLAGVRNLYITNGLGNPLAQPSGISLFRLELLLRGYKKSCGQRRPLRSPVTGNMLHKVCNVLKSSFFGVYLDSLMSAACMLAFFGFLRCGEFTTTDSNFNPSLNLCLKDVTICQDHVEVCIKVSKTDPFRSGCCIKIFKTDTVLCPYSAIVQFMHVRRSISNIQEEPFFLLPGAKPLSRQVFLTLFGQLCQAINVNQGQFTGHSFRIGAATTAAAVNTPDHLIQMLGRWQSNCYQRYIRTKNCTIRQAQFKMAHFATR